MSLKNDEPLEVLFTSYKLSINLLQETEIYSVKSNNE